MNQRAEKLKSGFLLLVAPLPTGLPSSCPAKHPLHRFSNHSSFLSHFQDKSRKGKSSPLFFNPSSDRAIIPLKISPSNRTKQPLTCHILNRHVFRPRNKQLHFGNPSFPVLFASNNVTIHSVSHAFLPGSSLQQKWKGQLNEPLMTATEK